MEENKNNKKFTLSLIAVLLLVMVFVSGGTFAYFRWISDPDTQTTDLSITIDENISMHIENPQIDYNKMYPTNNCAGEAAMSGVSIISVNNNTGSIARPSFKLKVKITDKNNNIITNTKSAENGNNPYRYYINYAVAEENGSCTEPLYTGKFYVDGDTDCTTKNAQGTCTTTDWYDSEWITLENESTGFPLISNGTNSGVSFNAAPYVTTTHNYKVWAWIDETYTSLNTGDVVSDKLQDATVTVSWSENSMVEQVKAKAYAVYSADDNSLRFYQSDEPINVGDTYNGLTVTSVYTNFEDKNYVGVSEVPWLSEVYPAMGRTDITSVVFEDTITPVSTAGWFYAFMNCEYFDVTKLNTSNVTNMNQMFSGVGLGNMSTFTITGMENWDVSNVTDMQNMFNSAGYKATTFNISDISGWDVSNVTTMERMFYSTGYSSTNAWELDISGWDVSNVTNMGYMFNLTGYYVSSAWELDLSSWNVYKVTSYDNFKSSNNITPPTWYTSYAVYSAQDESLRFYRTQTDLTQETEWNDLIITDAYTGFETAIYNNPMGVPWYSHSSSITTVVVENEIYPTSTAIWFANLRYTEYIDVTKLNTSNVTDMNNMFTSAGGAISTKFSIVGLENWNTSNVTSMGNMFSYVGTAATTVELGDLSNWDTSNVISMTFMFTYVGKNASILNLKGLENWDTSNVTIMSNMFETTGLNDENFALDLSKWNVYKVTYHNSFNTDVETKIIAPKWVN